ncbi:hypothetical protein COU37_02040 [Candidatus Micrarchaeota archaeon CG10_big_fil_rev_8_21_14_0_10_45_29]|nr:MAG: hypothetical protein COU37_02040 [Candidatus Micrarchaeota archaeon CG10_big_fil_rev_8_21_14_0_10_45_29]
MDIPNYCISLDSALSDWSLNNIVGGNWFYLVFISLFAMSLGVVAVFMAANALRIPKLQAWARFEFFQIVATAILAMFVMGWMWGMCHWDVSFLAPDYYGGAHGQEIMQNCMDATNVASAGTAEVSPYCVAQGYLKKVKTRGDDIYQALIAINYALSYIFKVTWNSSPMGIGYALEPLAGFQQLMNIFMVAISAFTLSYLSILVQMRVLDFFFLSMPYFFLPLGLLLRTFLPTREFGGAVMGLAIASMFFFPITLMLNDAIVYSSLEGITRQVGGQQINLIDSNSQTAAQIEGQTIYPSATATNISEGFGKLYDPKAGADGQLQQSADTDPAKVAKYFTESKPGENPLTNFASGGIDRLGAVVIWPYQAVMMYMIAGVLLPIINFIVYIEIARELTHALGTQMDLTNLTRMV